MNRREYIQTLEIRVQELMAENEKLKIEVASWISLTNQARRAMQEMSLFQQQTKSYNPTDGHAAQQYCAGDWIYNPAKEYTESPPLLYTVKATPARNEYTGFGCAPQGLTNHLPAWTSYPSGLVPPSLITDLPSHIVSGLTNHGNAQ